MTEASPQPAASEPRPTGERTPRRTLVGRVVSNKSEKTITVQVDRTYKHAKYGKYMRERKRYHAHVPEGRVNLGDQVEIMSSRPISKTKRWRLVRVVAAAVERGAEVSEFSKS